MTRAIGTRTRVARLALGIAAVIAAAACGDPVSVREIGTASQTVTVTPGAAFDVRLGTVGPGEYVSPPTLAAPGVVAYLGVDDGGEIVPAGARQRFHFRATARGLTFITFTHTNGRPTIVDTLVVR